MRNWSIISLAAMFILGGSMNSLQKNAAKNSVSENDDSKWIAQLKSTPLSEIESGLPNEPFGAWFDGHNKGAEVKYMIEACDGSANTEPLKKGTFSCVTATATRGIGSQIVMRFLVTGDQGSQGQPGCKFVIGSEGPPPGSPIKRMTRGFRSLGEMVSPAGR